MKLLHEQPNCPATGFINALELVLCAVLYGTLVGSLCGCTIFRDIPDRTEYIAAKGAVRAYTIKYVDPAVIYKAAVDAGRNDPDYVGALWLRFDRVILVDKYTERYLEHEIRHAQGEEHSMAWPDDSLN